jgi:DNA-binding GntR family transcriptional regulator
MLALRDAVARHLLAALRALDDPGPLLRRLTAEHEAILEAVEGRDPQGAARLVEAHIRGFYGPRGVPLGS